MANRLATQTSPYLRQHRDNPVDWYPWGTEALERAAEEDLPILLSVGYSACHWCHVMERESFEDEATAAYMNEHFVCIKVDREERPDLDAIYMEAVQAFTGQGGWPMTVFLDPDGVPFYGGTYFPPDESRGMPSFRTVMEAIVDAFETQREEIRERAPGMRERLAAIGAVEPRADLPAGPDLDRAVANLLRAADPANGGFGRAPKFPPASALELLMTRGGPGAAEHVVRTLDAMLAGGIYDQLGGGFARYSVDAAWLVPHFEKMLYDNGLLVRAYLHGWQRFGHERYRRVVEETLDWMLREMRGPEGGFYSALDADSEGEEGKFYVWTAEEVREVLGDERAEEFGAYYGVSEGGNFEGKNILHLANGAARAQGGSSGLILPDGGGSSAPAPDLSGGSNIPPAGGDDAPWPAGLAEARADLLAAREERVRPGLDDKRLTSWNALAIAALAEAGALLDRPDYIEAAEACAAFVLDDLTDEAGHLLRTYKDGVAHLNGYLEDHAFLLEALLVLYEAGFDPRWFAAARELADSMIDRFGDPERGGFWTTAADHEELIARRKEVGDHPIPAGNSAAALGLLRLAALSGERSYEQRAAEVFALFGEPAVKHPDSFAHFLRALDFHLAPTREVALVGADPSALAAVVRADFRPRVVLAAGPAGSSEPPLLDARTEVGGEPAAYVCEGFACRLPVTDPDALRRQLDDARS